MVVVSARLEQGCGISGSEAAIDARHNKPSVLVAKVPERASG